MVPENKSPQYALVAYVRGPVGKFVEGLRGELYPEHAHLAAHITVLPPRELRGTEADAAAELRRIAANFVAFEVEFGEAKSFAPATPTVFISVTKSAHRFRDMHEAFNTGPLACQEPWPYTPHLTIAKIEDSEAASQLLVVARQRWSEYLGECTARLEQLTFVRETTNGRWQDMLTISFSESTAKS